MSIRVVSKRAGGTKATQREMVINIARPSILGNPFHMNNESQRASVVAQYRTWLEQQYQSNPRVRAELERIAKHVRSGEQVAVECWCAPCACHGDVVVAAVKWINQNEPT